MWLAAARLAALYINGNWRRSPMLRLIGAATKSRTPDILTTAFGRID
jgi:hypothetical protein